MLDRQRSTKKVLLIAYEASLYIHTYRRGRRVVARATTFLFRNIEFNKNKILTLFDISFKKGLGKGRLTNEINKMAIADAEISDNRNGQRVGYDQALYPRLHDVCFLS